MERGNVIIKLGIKVLRSYPYSMVMLVSVSMTMTTTMALFMVLVSIELWFLVYFRTFKFSSSYVGIHVTTVRRM